jgi:PAS domain S-box-containing protein
MTDPAKPTLDWAAVACLVAERQVRPLVVLDHEAHIQVVNTAMEKTLGRERCELVGKSWQLLVGESDRSSIDGKWFKQAQRGALNQIDFCLNTATGDQVLLSCAVSSVGQPPEHGVLLVAERVVVTERSKAPGLPLVSTYRVSIEPGRRYELLRVESSGGTVPSNEGDKRCFANLYGRDAPCERCPLSEPQAEPRTTTTRLCWLDSQSGDETKACVVITTLLELDKDAALLNARFLSSDEMGSIHEAKLAHVSQRGGLTSRETEVFRYLFQGRAVEDIAQGLGISARTVKYHQANLLQKLGAESRADLVRLLF